MQETFLPKGKSFTFFFFLQYSQKNEGAFIRERAYIQNKYGMCLRRNVTIIFLCILVHFSFRPQNPDYSD